METRTPDYKKYLAEVVAFEAAEPTSISLPPLAALAIVFYIQVTIRQVADAPGRESLRKVARRTAEQLQELFHSDTETYKIIQLGWDLLEPDAPLTQQAGGGEDD